MKKVVFLLSALFMSACTQIKIAENKTPDRVLAKDNYRFLVKEYENLTPGVEFILIKSEEEREIVFKEVFGNEWKKIAGFTFWNPGKSTCRIVIPDPDWQYQPEIIGHEVAHCIWGKFHQGELGKGAIINQPMWNRGVE